MLKEIKSKKKNLIEETKPYGSFDPKLILLNINSYRGMEVSWTKQNEEITQDFFTNNQWIIPIWQYKVSVYDQSIISFLLYSLHLQIFIYKINFHVFL